MKTKTAIQTLFLLSVVFFISCKKDNTNFNSYFWTSNDIEDSELTLYVNDQIKGPIPYLKDKPTCENDTLKAKALYLNLKAGKYKISAKDKQGNVKVSSTIKVKSNSLSSSAGIGGTENFLSNDCLLVGVTY
ncbi:MAG: hypothetical protein H0V01_12520 [Bacteroidetes bacterium]|nr:hypothetical protein [Bacteroidota bacterium]HET6245346.1 hypothetical protein [Bacteroidia bacterium]